MMTSDRQRAANRANAQRSTGPKSRAGKARASLNAYRHGLAARTEIGSDRGQRIDELARQLSNLMPGQISLAHARLIAQAEIDLSTARAAARTLMSQLCGPAPGCDSALGPGSLSDDDGRVGAVHELKMVERYVRRAQARRDRSIRLCLFGRGE
ncbi:hypothetical protein [Bradyrhizobium sp. STM 3566]|uniref:hypothetical protein n=1 Tax=Bradyrhizobium sp. STM 3566 TaxID=578928 RepID=UPI00388FAEC9